MMIDIQHLDKSYWADETEVPVLKDVCFTVDDGEYVSIMGPSGSGKSTLMNIIGCLDVPSAGTYLLNGENVAELSDNAMSKLRNRTIGFVFQNFNLLPRETALENVALPLVYNGTSRRERLQRAAEALEQVGLSDRITYKPTQLSGGQKQRVAIARAMINNPKLLLADEPTGALDTASGQQVMDLFRQLNRSGVTVVMITHDPEIAACADRTIHIRDGRLVEGGAES